MMKEEKMSQEKQQDPYKCWFCHETLRYPGQRCQKCGEAQ